MEKKDTYSKNGNLFIHLTVTIVVSSPSNVTAVTTHFLKRLYSVEYSPAQISIFFAPENIISAYGVERVLSFNETSTPIAKCK